MKVADVIRAAKTNVDVGGWKSGKIPNAQFPLARSSLHLGRGWEWRIVTFDALSTSFRVLICISLEKESYRAVLALDDGPMLRVLCHHELHTTHWNWHCHFYDGEATDVHPGVLRDRDRFRAWPYFKDDQNSTGFTITKEAALTVAANRYRFEAQGALL